jgi:hypothetical protein
VNFWRTIAVLILGCGTWIAVVAWMALAEGVAR